MAIVKHFECEHCGAVGKIALKGHEVDYQDIVFCPVCSGDIYDEELDGVDDDQ